MIVAVFFGSRSWVDIEAVEEVVERLALIDGSLKGIHGGARGLDQLADQVLKRRGFQPIAVPAEWRVHDRAGATPVPCRCREPRSADLDVCKAAGIRRNQRIIDEHLIPAIADPTAEVWVCGFKRTDGLSPGTDDMRARLRPYVAAGEVRGIFTVAGGMPPAERMRPRPPRVDVTNVTSSGGRLEPFPEAD